MIVTRFAPSPTGYLHIGGLRTAIFNYLWARKNNGKFILRIEDTDQKRNNEDAIKAILNAFTWSGLDYDELYYQSKRQELYKKYIQKLLDEKKAYKCYMSKEELESLRNEQIANKQRPRYNGKYRDFTKSPPKGIEPCIRIKAPLSGEIEFFDGVKGLLNFSVKDNLDDFIIARADQSPTYNFVVAVDDALMGVNNVIRGDDHLSNTPKQIIVYKALGFEIPKFYHLAMIHNNLGKKLSKRDGATDLMEYKKEGYLKDALNNFLLRLGFSYGDKEIFTKEEMLNLFEPSKINKSAAVYNKSKLIWLNKEYINKSQNLEELLKDFDINLKGINKKEELLNCTKTRANTLKDLAKLIKTIINQPKEYEQKALKKISKEENIKLLKIFNEELKKGSFNSVSSYQNLINDIINKENSSMSKLAGAIRLALVGTSVSPAIADLLNILSKDENILRIENLLKFIENNNT